MKIAVAPDKYKGTLTATQALQAICESIHEICPDAELHSFPMADGGEGTADILGHEMGFTRYNATIHPPLSGLSMTEATYYYSEDERAVIFDSATAAGLTLIPPERRDIMRASTAPIGELLEIVQQRHDVRSVFIGLGGTATCDAGLGMVLYMVKNHVKMPSIVGLYDAGVPLVATGGAPSALTFAPQKGANADDMAMLEMRLHKAIKMMPEGNPDTPGAGAAGGLGFAILAMGGKLVPGVEVVAGNRITSINPDLIITGEGRIDSQSSMGKVVSYFIKYHREHGTPVVAIGGTISPDNGLSTDNESSRGDLTALIAADAYEPHDVKPITPQVAAWRIREAIADRLPAILASIN